MYNIPLHLRLKAKKLGLTPIVINGVLDKLMSEHSEYDICPADPDHLFDCWQDININHADYLVSEPLVFNNDEIEVLSAVMWTLPEWQRLFDCSTKYWDSVAAEHAYFYG